MSNANNPDATELPDVEAFEFDYDHFGAQLTVTTTLHEISCVEVKGTGDEFCIDDLFIRKPAVLQNNQAVYESVEENILQIAYETWRDNQ